MVEEQIRNDRDFLMLAGLSHPLENIGFDDPGFDPGLSKGSQRARAYNGLTINKNYLLNTRKIMPKRPREQRAVARAQVDDAPDQRLVQRLPDETGVAHEAVDSNQIGP